MISDNKDTDIQRIEIYRTQRNNPTGQKRYSYIFYDCGSYWEISKRDFNRETEDRIFRIGKDYLDKDDFSNKLYMDELTDRIVYGSSPRGQVYLYGSWYGKAV